MALKYSDYEVKNKPYRGDIRRALKKELEDNFKGTIPELREAEANLEARVNELYKERSDAYNKANADAEHRFLVALCNEYPVNLNVGRVLLDHIYSNIGSSYSAEVENYFEGEVGFYRKIMEAQQNFVSGKEITAPQG